MIAKALEKVNALTAEKNPKKCPELQVGDIVRVSVRIKEGDKERVQVFAGDVIARESASRRSSPSPPPPSKRSR